MGKFGRGGVEAKLSLGRDLQVGIVDPTSTTDKSSLQVKLVAATGCKDSYSSLISAQCSSIMSSEDNCGG